MRLEVIISRTVTRRERQDVSVTQKWSDNDNQDGKRTPSVMVRLLADGQVVAGSGGAHSARQITGHIHGMLLTRRKMDRPSTTQLRRLQLSRWLSQQS